MATMFTAAAEQVSPAQALATAKRFMAPASTGTGVTTNSITQMRLAYTPGSADAAGYYVFTRNGDNGFVIVSGDDRLPQIVGYSFSNQFDPDMMPDGLKAYLADYTALVDGVRQGEAVPSAVTGGGAAIGPLMTVQWDQDAPFNDKCPRVGLQRAATGCVATAMAQVMKYHSHPAQGNGTVTWEGTKFDLSKSTYNWAMMPDRYLKGSYTSAQAAQVAQLMLDCGHAVQMEYGTESGALTEYVAPALVKNFGYDGAIEYQVRSGWSDEAWIQLIRYNLGQGWPVIYGGNGDAGGHQFICDGIDTDDLLHINWGWSGMSDGFYDMNILSPDDVGIGGSAITFNEGQDMVCGIRPAGSSNDASSWQPHLILCAMTIATKTDSSGRYKITNATNPAIQAKFEIDNATGGAVKFKFGYVICDADGNEVSRTIGYSGSFADAGYYIPSTTVSVSVKDLPAGKYHVMWRWQDNTSGTSQELREFWVGDLAEGFWFEVRSDGYYEAEPEQAGLGAVMPDATSQWFAVGGSGEVTVSGAPDGSSIQIFTADGALVASATASGETTTVSAGSASAGLRIVAVMAPDGSRKVFKTIVR